MVLSFIELKIINWVMRKSILFDLRNYYNYLYDFNEVTESPMSN